MRISKVLLLILTFTISAAQSQEIVFRSNGKVNYPLTRDEEKMLDSIQHKTFLFFLNEHQPEMGIVKDRTTSESPSSIAATGFGIPSFAIGAERKWITREQAAEITLRILQFFINSVQSTDINVTGYKGFYYHFLKMDTGTRKWDCELSSVDTGILMMGIIFARNYYDLDNETEKQIRSIATRLLDRVDWNFMLLPASGKSANTISMGWTPEKGLLILAGEVITRPCSFIFLLQEAEWKMRRRVTRHGFIISVVHSLHRVFACCFSSFVWPPVFTGIY